MYSVVRWIKITETASPDEIANQVEDGFFPIIKAVPGFRAYYLLDLGDRTVGSITIFDTREGLDESVERAADWVRANLAPSVEGPPTMISGEVKTSLVS